MSDQSESDAEPGWWSAIQAIAWLVARTDQAVSRVEGHKLLRSLKFLTPVLRPRSSAEAPPIPLKAAPYELLTAARAGRVLIVGRRRGIGPIERVQVDEASRLQDHGDEVCIGHDDVYRGGNYWSCLSLRAEECMAVWPRRDKMLESSRVSQQPIEPVPRPEIELEIRADAWLRNEMVQRAKTSEDRSWPAMTTALTTEFPELKDRRARELIRALPSKLRPKRGPAKGPRGVSLQK
jgi:hypothetical protein